MFQVTGTLKRSSFVMMLLGATIGAVAVGILLVSSLSRPNGVYWFLAGLDLVLSFVFYPLGLLQLIFLSLIGELISEEATQLTPVKILGFVVAFRRLIDLTFFGRALHVIKSASMVWAFIFVLSLGLSMFATRDIYGSVTALLTYIQLLIMFFLIIDFVRGERELKYLLVVLVLGGLVNAGFALYQAYFGNLARVEGMIGNANRFGIIQLVLLCQMVPFLGLLSAGGLLPIGLFASGLVAHSILLSFSRGVFVAAVVLALYGFLFLRSGGARFKVTLSVVVVAGLVLAPEGLYDRIETISAFLSGTRLHEGSISTRLLYLKAGIRMGLDHFLTGVGLSQFDYHIPTYANLRTVMAGGAHNMYVSVFAEAGGIGLIAFLGFLATGFLAARSGQRRSLSGTKFQMAFASSVELGNVAMLLGGLFATLEYSKVLWILLAFAAIMRKLDIRLKDTVPG